VSPSRTPSIAISPGEKGQNKKAKGKSEKYRSHLPFAFPLLPFALIYYLMPYE